MSTYMYRAFWGDYACASLRKFPLFESSNPDNYFAYVSFRLSSRT